MNSFGAVHVFSVSMLDLSDHEKVSHKCRSSVVRVSQEGPEGQHTLSHTQKKKMSKIVKSNYQSRSLQIIKYLYKTGKA